MFLIVNAVMISDMKTTTTQMNLRLENLIDKKEDLKLELEKRDNLKYIEEIAKNQFGMIKKEYVTKHYITLGSVDKIEVIGNSDNNSEPIVENADN